MAAAMKLFLLPGEVDFETQSACGPDAEAFAEKLAAPVRGRRESRWRPVWISKAYALRSA